MHVWEETATSNCDSPCNRKGSNKRDENKGESYNETKLKPVEEL